MRLVFALILIIGMGLAGFAVYMAQGRFSEYQNALAQQKKQIQNNVPLVGVFVSNGPLQYGQKLTKKDVRIVAWPKDAVPEGTFIDPKILFNEDPTKLRTIVRAMEKDEAIMASKVTEPGEDAGVASRLTAGMRAFTIRVDVASGVSGFLRPGDSVDVYWTGRVDKRDVTRLILQDVKLIAVDQVADIDRKNPTVATTVTAEVSPSVVASLAQAQSTGRLLLSLRGATDTSVSGQIEVDQEQLLGVQKKMQIEKPRKKICTVKSRKGTTVTEIPVPCPTE